MPAEPWQWEMLRLRLEQMERINKNSGWKQTNKIQSELEIITIRNKSERERQYLTMATKGATYRSVSFSFLNLLFTGII